MIDLERQGVSLERAAGELLTGLGNQDDSAILLADRNGSISFLNPAADTLLGRTHVPASARGLVDSALSLFTPDGVPLRVGERFIQPVFETGRPISSERVYLTLQDDDRLVLQVSAQPLTGVDGRVAGVLLALRNVAEHDSVESIVRRHMATLRAQAELLDLAREGIFVRDLTSSTIVYWNRGAEEMYGFTRQEAIGRVSHELLNTRFPEPLAQIEQAMLSAGQWVGELLHRARDGRELTVESRWALQTDESGAPTAFLEINHDITARRQAEQEISERVEQLVTANQAIEAKNREIAAVNASMAAVTQALDLSQVLQTIVDVARDLVQCRFAAVGVADGHGRITQFITSGITFEERAAIGPLPQGHGLLGTLIRDGIPLRIENIARDHRSQGFPPHHPPMKSLLGVPIRGNGGVLGNLYLTEKIGAESFSEADQSLLLIFAAQAAIAIENARLYDDARLARDQLRTWNRNLEETITERTREIEHVTREMTARIFQAQESERRRIARELHDETAQSLATLLIELDLLKTNIPEGDVSLTAGAGRLELLLRRTLDEVRTLSHDLRPSILDDFGLVAAIQAYAEEWSRTFAVPVRVHADTPPPSTLPADLEIALFRVAQEALNNAGKHARARSVDISLSWAEDRVLLVVQDDGVGFELDRPRVPTRLGGLGLYGMQERAALLGGTLTIETSPGHGARITLSAPL